MTVRPLAECLINLAVAITGQAIGVGLYVLIRAIVLRISKR